MAAAPVFKPKLFVRVRRRVAQFECAPELQLRLKPLFAYRHPNADFIHAVRVGTWDGYINLMQRGNVSAGLFNLMRPQLEREYNLVVDEQVDCPQFRPATDTTLRPYQQRAVEAMVRASGQGGIILSATGSGKTKLAGSYFQRLIGTGVFIVDELALLEQSRREIAAAAGEEVGIVGRSEFLPRRITVATVQTLHKHRERPAFRKWFEQVDVMIIDELHVQLNRRNFDTVRKVRPKAVFGLTATLQLEKRHVKLEAVALTGPVIFEYPIQQGVEEGYLSGGQIFIVPFNDPLRGRAPGYWSIEAATRRRIWIEPGSPAAEYRYHICVNKARNDLIERLVRESLQRGRRIFLLVERKVHLSILSKRFHDVTHYALSGDIKAETRLEAMANMDAGKIQLVLASRVFAKGVNVKSVDCIIDATGQPSQNNALQRYGRGARKAEGKDELLYYDVADRNNPYADAAWARYEALKETGAPITML